MLIGQSYNNRIFPFKPDCQRLNSDILLVDRSIETEYFLCLKVGNDHTKRRFGTSFLGMPADAFAGR